MATPSGISSQFGWKVESVFGTAVTPDRFLPMRSESITDTYSRSVADDIIAGQQTMLTEQIRAGNKQFAGSVGMYMFNRNIAELFEGCLGANSTSGAGPYTHTVTPADPSESYTLQVGRPDTGGTVNPFTYEGVQIQRIGVAATAGEFVTMDVDVVAEDVATGTGLATAAYPASLARYHANDLAITIAAGSICARNFEIEFSNQFDDTRFCVGSQVIRQPVRNDHLQVSGSLEVEWTDLTEYNRVVNLTNAELVATFTNGADTVTMTCDCNWDASSMPVAGRGVIYQTLEFVGVGAATDGDTVTVEIVNADAVA